MTILSPNQPWPQVYVRRYDYALGQYREVYEDNSIINVVIQAREKYHYCNGRPPSILFAGPRGDRKIKDLFIEDQFILAKTKNIFGTQKREFLGLELILTVDDGLWMA